ncbi:glycosyltransferase [Winogradskyella maritima]|uniref:Glycosyltransferase family 2 protein n=1 Tax=Winogradskyella maritima TaxID=1517766 RepID=A0ABV8AKI7_9FLAO|nr:glycosyltransferase [Winogradskyella maritima]
MRTDKYPLVSICIPTYNGANFIEEAIKSVLNQSYKNIEIIVSDDNSSDATLSIIKHCLSESKIKLNIHQHNPMGIGANWNNCVRKANGEFIKFLFQDDVLTNNCLEEMVNKIILSESIGLVYSRRAIIGKKKNKDYIDFVSVYGNLHNYWGELNVVEGIHSGKLYLKDSQFLNAPKNKIGEPTSVLLRRSCFDKIGYFNEDLKQALDCEFWYRLMPYYDIGFVDKILSKFRYHNMQASQVNKQNKINETEYLYKSYYRMLMPYLNAKCRWKLMKLYHPIWSTLVKIKNIIYANRA